MTSESTSAGGAATAAPTRPMTGEEYLESLRDGREIWLYGERVPDVTAHPAFRNTARMVARLYDAPHDPRTRDGLADLLRFCVATGVRPLIDDVRPMAQAAESFARLAAGNVFGKLVLTT